MTRQEKIKLLQAIANGTSMIEEMWIWPNNWRTWVQDDIDHDLFQCTNENLTWRRGEQLPDESTAWGNIFMHNGSKTILENEKNTITFK